MQMTKGEFAGLMAKLRAHYQNPVGDEALWLASVATYWDEMKDLDPEAIRRGFDAAWRKHEEWMPSCGQLVSLIDGGGSDAKQLAVEAWPEVVKLASRSSAAHSDPTAAKVIALMGGGKTLGQTPLDELEKWTRKSFIDLYVEVSSKGPAVAPERMLKPPDDPNDKQLDAGRVSELVSNLSAGINEF